MMASGSARQLHASSPTTFLAGDIHPLDLGKLSHHHHTQVVQIPLLTLASAHRLRRHRKVSCGRLPRQQRLAMLRDHLQSRHYYRTEYCLLVTIQLRQCQEQVQMEYFGQAPLTVGLASSLSPFILKPQLLHSRHRISRTQICLLWSDKSRRSPSLQCLPRRFSFPRPKLHSRRFSFSSKKVKRNSVPVTSAAYELSPLNVKSITHPTSVDVADRSRMAEAPLVNVSNTKRRTNSVDVERKDVPRLALKAATEVSELTSPF